MIDVTAQVTKSGQPELPDAQAHHHNAERQPSEHAHGYERFEADSLVLFPYLSLELILVHVRPSARWKVGQYQ